MSKINIEYYGVHGEGRTVKEAKANAGRKISEAMNGSYEPVIVRGERLLGIVWRHPLFGLYSSLIGSDDKPSGITWYNETIEQTTDRMKLNIAQLEANIGFDEMPMLIAGNKRLEAQYRSWLGFQRAYRAATGNDLERHEWACYHGHEFEPKAA